MYQKSIPMSYEQAAKIASDLLDILQSLFEQRKTPVRLTLWNEETGGYCPNITYSVKDKQKHRYFELTFFADPDDLGYCSMLPEYDPSTYVVCDIVEKRSDGTKKYEMTFGFDIERRTFLELFEITHHNTVGILREYPNWDSKIEAELKDVVIL